MQLGHMPLRSPPSLTPFSDCAPSSRSLSSPPMATIHAGLPVWFQPCSSWLPHLLATPPTFLQGRPSSRTHAGVSMSTFNAAKLLVAFSTTGINVLQSDIGQAEGKLRGFQAATASAGKSMTAFATVPIAGFFTAAFLGASNLEQAQGKVDAVFKNSSGEIMSWAQNSATAFGLSRGEALASAGTFGALFQAMGLTEDASAGMSTNIIELAADLSAFNDVPVADAVAALQSGLVGETEPMRRFGVVLNDNTVKAKAMEMGLADANGEVSESAKVQARYQLILEQTNAQQGQFQREASGAAGSMAIARAEFRNAAETLGTHLLPIGTQVVQMITSLIQWVNNLSPAMQRWGMIALAVVAAIGPLLVGISMMLPAISAIIGVVSSVIGVLTSWSAIMGVLGTVVGVLTSPITLVVVAIAGLIAILVIAYTHLDGFRNAINGVAGTVASAFSSAVVWFEQFAWYISSLLQSGESLNVWFAQLPGPMQAIVGAIGQVVVGLQSFGRYIMMVLADGDALNDWLTHIPGPLQGIVLAIGNTIVAIQGMVSAIAEWINSGQAVQTMSAIWQAFWGILQPILVGAIGMLASLGSALMGAFQGFMASGIPEMIGTAMQGLWNALKNVFDAVRNGNPIMLALAGALLVAISPIGLVAAGIAALVAILTTAYAKSETFRSIVDAAFRVVGVAAQILAEALGATLAGAIDVISLALNGLAALLRFDVGAAFSAMGTVIQTVAGVIGAIMTPVLILLQGAFTQLGNIVTFFASILRGDLGGAFNALVSFITTPITTLAQFGAAILNLIAQIPIVGGVISALGGFFTSLGGVVQSASNAVAGALQAIANAILGGLQSASNAVTGFIGGAWALLTGAISGTVAAVLAILAGMLAGVVAVFVAIGSAVSGAMSLIQTAVQGGWSIVQTIVSGAMALISSVVSAGWSLISGVVSAAVSGIASVVSATWSAISSTVSAIVSGLVAVVTGAWNGLLAVLTGIVSAISGVITSTWSSLSATVTGIVSGFVGVVTGLWNTLLSTVTGIVSNILSTVTSTISSMASTAQSTVSGMVSAIIGFFSNLLNDAVSKVTSIKDGIVSKFNEAKTGAVNAVTGLASEILSALTGLIGSAGELAKSIGGAIVGGLTDSISGGVGAVTDAMKSLPSKGVDTVKGILGINSPSRVFAEIGANTIEGFSVGMLATLPNALRTISGITDGITAGFTPSVTPVQGPIGLAAAGQVNHNTYITMHNTIDLKSAKELVEAAVFFDEMERAKDIVLGAGRR